MNTTRTTINLTTTQAKKLAKEIHHATTNQPQHHHTIHIPTSNYNIHILPPTPTTDPNQMLLF